jgi:thiamine-phosphate pyrophosphorylase
MILPRLYPILDAEVCRAQSTTPGEVARQLAAAGVQLVQYRDKTGSPQEILENAALLRRAFGPNATLMMNDRVDLALLAGFDGVHLGQSDLPPRDAARIADERSAPLLIGLSTHTEDQVLAAEFSSICLAYVAIGPVFSTTSKGNAEPVVGLEGVRMARNHTIHSIVAIGGITLANAASVIAAGADSIAVISALFSKTQTVEQVARDFLALLA